jgi:hypothetical protein
VDFFYVALLYGRLNPTAANSIQRSLVFNKTRVMLPRNDPGDVSTMAERVLQRSATSDYILGKVAMQWRLGVYVAMEREVRVLSGDP